MRRHLAAAGAALLLALGAACEMNPRDEDLPSAMDLDPAASPQGPDSTAGVSERTGLPSPAGDTLTPDIQENEPINAAGDTVRYGRPPRPEIGPEGEP